VIRCLIRKSPEDLSRLEPEVLTGSRKSFHGAPFVPTTDSRSVPMDPKKMLQRIVLYGRDLSILVGSNERTGNKDLAKIFPQFFSNGEIDYPAIPRELFEESVRKIFPTLSSQVNLVVNLIYCSLT